MILFCFPLPVENPFPLKLSRKEIVLFENKALCLVGTGNEAAQNLETILKETPSISHVVEVGGAGVSPVEAQGRTYEASHLINPDSGNKISLKKMTNAPEATTETVSDIFRKKTMQSRNTITLFTQETWHLFQVTKKHGIPFSSIRTATDSGEDDVRTRFVKSLQASRKNVVSLINNIDL